METVNERIEMLIKHFANGKQGDFSRKIGVVQATISGIVSGRQSKPSYEIIQKIISTYPVNSDWLINGTGEMLAKEQDSAQISEFVSMPRKVYDFIMSEFDRYRKREDERNQILLKLDNLEKLGKYRGNKSEPEVTNSVTRSIPLLRVA